MKEANNMHVGTPVKVDEKSRTYVYAQDGGLVECRYEDVVELIVRPSGSHRLVTADGKLHFASAGFLSIRIEPKEKGQWTV